MIVIRAIESYIPRARADNRDRLAQFGLSEEFLRNKLGVLKTARKAPDEETSDMCVRAFAALSETTDTRIDDVDFIAVCTQNPDGYGIPQTSAIVHAKLGAKSHCAAFDISLACSGYVYSLSIAKSFMEANGLETGLLFTADPYSKILDPDDKNTSLLFGDAATVTLLSEPEPGKTAWLPTCFRFSTLSEDAEAVNNRSGTLLFQDSLAIVVSAMRVVPPEVDALLREKGLNHDDVDLFVFHQGNKYILESLSKRMRLPPEKVPCNIAEVGNTVSTTIPLVFREYLHRDDIKRVVCNGFGAGLSVGTCILESL
jgi:3-oxoacyl-[acyl-carrier-protein] synthase-3